MKTMEQNLYRLLMVAAAMVLMVASSQLVLADGANSFTQTNLVSDIPGIAKTTDPNLVNPWGVSFSASSPFWISDNKTGLVTLYNGAGDIIPLVVTVPTPGAPPSAPTGQVFNGNASNFGGSHFIFATEDGTISAWSGGTSATLYVDNSPAGSVYKGLAMASFNGNSYLYATDFHNGTINVFDSAFMPHSFGAGSFTDPNLPSGYAPFNIETINGQLYVTYAKQDGAKHDDVSGPGNGLVDVFSLDGVLQTRLITNGALNSPWGMTLAPSSFGSFGGDLLVGNFGDGTINAFDPFTGNFIGQLDGTNGLPLVNLGLWDLTFGNGGNGGSRSDLYFTAGIPGPGKVEDHGLFGSIAPTPEPGTLALIGSGMLGLIAYRRRRTDSFA
jgi:uncharacterized protein (TIGR03118 family)